MMLDDLLEAEVLFYFVSVYGDDPDRPRQTQFPAAERRAFTEYVEKMLRAATAHSISVAVGTEECVYPWGDFYREPESTHFMANAECVRRCLTTPTRARLVITPPVKWVFVNCPEIADEFADDEEYARLLEAHLNLLARGEVEAEERGMVQSRAAFDIAKKLLADARKGD